MNNKLQIFKNNIIIYSVSLIIVIVTVIFFNTYYFVDKFESVSDRLLQNSAVLAEDVLGIMINDIDGDTETLKRKITQIKAQDEEILNITILKPSDEKESFDVVTSTDELEEGVTLDNELFALAWHNEEGIAVLDKEGSERFWKIVKPIKQEGEQVGLVEMHISLEKNDIFINKAIRQIYIVTVIVLCIVLLLIINHMNMFKYVLKSKKLEEIDEMKDNFISMASHELKSPLTAISGYAELLKDSVSNNCQNEEIQEKELKYINNIDISAERLKNLVEDILEVSRIEQGSMKIEMKNINITDIINNTIEQASVNAENKNLKLVFEDKEKYTGLLVYADETRVQQIIINLISNAIKYTPQGSVKIFIKEDKKYVDIIVEDTGMGISAENLKNLFEKFYRIKNQKTEKISGTGLGLWISKELARKMDGDLTVESMEGVGSHFILRLRQMKKSKF
jgi:signal transduction histidine kinase